jgi:endonuclease YncB( thermonuclease family)
MNTDGMKARRRFRFILGSLLALVMALAIADRAGAFGYRGDDWSRYNQKAVRMIEVIDGDTFRAKLDGSEDVITVRLIGVDAPEMPDAHWCNEAKRYTEARLTNRAVTLRLDGTQTRDEAGNLLAYVYIHDNDCLNVDIVRDAQAFADRRVRHTLRSSIETLETQARLKRRGMWKDLSDDHQPAWRQDWLRSLRARRK